MTVIKSKKLSSFNLTESLVKLWTLNCNQVINLYLKGGVSAMTIFGNLSRMLVEA